MNGLPMKLFKILLGFNFYQVFRSQYWPMYNKNDWNDRKDIVLGAQLLVV